MKAEELYNKLDELDGYYEISDMLKAFKSILRHFSERTIGEILNNIEHHYSLLPSQGETSFVSLPASDEMILLSHLFLMSQLLKVKSGKKRDINANDYEFAKKQVFSQLENHFSDRFTIKDKDREDVMDNLNDPNIMYSFIGFFNTFMTFIPSNHGDENMSGGSIKKILILAANPKNTPRLRLDEEVREIEESLRRAKHGNRFSIYVRWAVRLRGLRGALLDVEPQIVHFIGHGKENGLLLEDELGFAIPVPPDALSELFELFSDKVEFIILSACYSESQADAIVEHINYATGMRGEIKDKASIEFAVGFYDALGAGRSVEESFKFGCLAIRQIFPNLPEHLIPILKKRRKS